MEPLWIPVVATSGNLWQIAQAQKPRNQAKTVAVDCDRAPEKFHGKEGVDGSSPSEGSAKAAHTGLLLSLRFADPPTYVG
jgi:hypothetical protein